MKRMWIGVALLALVLISGVLAAEWMNRTHSAMASDMDRAVQLAMEENWDAAAVLTAKAEQNWQKKRPVTAAFAEHEPLENIDGLFAQLKIYAASEDAVAFSAACAYLARELEALGECHSFSIYNLL